MKNIYALPTKDSSKIGYISESEQYHIFTDGANPHDIADNLALRKHIYITSKEVPELDWWRIDPKHNTIHKSRGFATDPYNQDYTKIILTTDQILIKGGVQEIDIEFLEWFVKNPNCEYVETFLVEVCTSCGTQYCGNLRCRGYKNEKIYLTSTSENTTKRIITYCDGHEVKIEQVPLIKEVSKQETFDEVSLCIELNRVIDGGKDLVKGHQVSRGHAIHYAFDIALKASKWQASQLHNESNMSEYAHYFESCYSQRPMKTPLKPKEWFEQFKKRSIHGTSK